MIEECLCNNQTVDGRKAVFMSFLNFIKILVVISAVSLLICSCGHAKKDSENEENAPSSETPTAVKSISSYDDFNSVVANAGNGLLVFDLYADWCVPCRMLSPALEKIAQDNQSRAAFYKINIDKVPQVSQSFNVRGIPHVAFMKNGTVVETIVGLHSPEAYEKALTEHSGAAK
jgi:thioredoxin 1